MREEELIKNLLELIDSIDMNELGLKARIKEENVDMRTFVKYILKEGSMLEKRELLSNMRSKLVLTKEGFTLQK